MTEKDLEVIFASLPNRSMLTINEVAAFFRIKKRTVYNWYPGQLQGTLVGGMIRIYRQSVIDLVLKNNNKKKNDEIPEEIERKIIKSTRRIL